MKRLITLAIFSIFFGNANAQNTSKDFAAMNYEVQFIRTGLEGTILFKIFSYGKNEDQAIENSKSDALKAVMFKGIPGSDMREPMIKDMSVLETRKDFFETFFNTKQYLQYVSIFFFTLCIDSLDVYDTLLFILRVDGKFVCLK